MEVARHVLGFSGLITAVPVADVAGVILRFAVRHYRECNLYTGKAGANPRILLEPSMTYPYDEDH